MTTHELGHNFGAEHDPDDIPDCAPREDQGGKFVMYPIAVSGDHVNNKVPPRLRPCSPPVSSTSAPHAGRVVNAASPAFPDVLQLQQALHREAPEVHGAVLLQAAERQRVRELPGGAGRGLRPGAAAHQQGPLLHPRLQAESRSPVQVRNR